MMHNNFQIHIPFKIRVFFLIVLIFNGCKQDAKEDPCKEYLGLEKGFKVLEIINLQNFQLPDLEIETDTVFQDAVFRASTTYDSCSWTFGSDTIVRHGIQVNLDFTNPKGDGEIKVTMIGKRKVNLLCLPNDDGVDTFVKFIHNVSISQLGFYGNYEGYDQNKPDSLYLLRIKRNPNPPDTNWVFYLDSLKSDCVIIPNNPNTPAFYSAEFGTKANGFWGGCPCNIKAYGYREKESGNLIIKRYFLDRTNNQFAQRTFIGHKKQ